MSTIDARSALTQSFVAVKDDRSQEILRIVGPHDLYVGITGFKTSSINVTGNGIIVGNLTVSGTIYDGSGTAYSAGGGGGGAPTTVSYVTLATDATLTQERVLTQGTGISITDGGAGAAVTIALSTPVSVANGGTGGGDAATARTNLGLGTISTQASNSVSITGGSVTGITDLAVADGGTGASDALTARTNLGLGTIATQSSSNIAITGGSITGITDLAIADGGTGASDALTARSNLGLGSLAVKSTVGFSDIDDTSVTNSKLANVSTSTIKGRSSTGTGSPEDLTGTQATALLDTFTPTLKGLAPSSGGGNTTFLRADGTWKSPVAGSNTQILFNDAASMGADAGLTYNKTTDSLFVLGSITGSIITGSMITVSGHVTGTNAFFRGNITGSIIAVSGDVTGTNALFRGDVAVDGGEITTSSSTFTISNPATTTQTFNFVNAATISSNTKTVNIGTGGAANSITNVNLGSVDGLGFVTSNGDLKYSKALYSSAPQVVSINSNVDGSSRYIRVTAAATLSLPPLSTALDGRVLTIVNANTSATTITIAPDGTDKLIDLGSTDRASVALTQRQWIELEAKFITNGNDNAWYVVCGGQLPILA